jgi:hypothetical protein
MALYRASWPFGSSLRGDHRANHGEGGTAVVGLHADPPRNVLPLSGPVVLGSFSLSVGTGKSRLAWLVTTITIAVDGPYATGWIVVSYEVLSDDRDTSSATVRTNRRHADQGHPTGGVSRRMRPARNR